MPGSTFGQIFRVTTFGESHGAAIGVVVDGCPAGLNVDILKIQHDLDRRRPGQSDITTQRKESDTVQVLSGIFEGKTTGTPIALFIQNEDALSKDYSHIKNTFRPSHADFTYEEKYGLRDYRGGGRSSARETAVRVAAGSIAKQLLAQEEISVQAFVSQIGKVKLRKHYSEFDLADAEKNLVRCPSGIKAGKMLQQIEQAKQTGDTLGGMITCVIKGCPVGLGEPVFDKLHAELAKAVMSINAVKGFEIGSGFEAVKMKGSEHNDIYEEQEGKIITKTNYSGGIQGGISNGMDIYFNVAFKPVATIMQKQQSVDKSGEAVTIEGKGRHDPCVVPRAVPIVEAMAALVLADHYLRNRNSKL